MRHFLAVAVTLAYLAFCLAPIAVVVWKDYATTDVEDEPSRIRLLVSAALVVSAPLLAKGSGVWFLQTLSLLGTAWLIAPAQYRRWLAVASVVGTPILLRVFY